VAVLGTAATVRDARDEDALHAARRAVTPTTHGARVADMSLMMARARSRREGNARGCVARCAMRRFGFEDWKTSSQVTAEESRRLDALRRPVRANSELILDGETEDGGDDGDEGVGAIVIVVGEEEVPTDDGG